MNDDKFPLNKIRLVQLEVTPGNPKENFKKCKSEIEIAKSDGINLIVFPELCLSGYLIGDLWEDPSFIQDCDYYGRELARLSTKNLSIIFGNVCSTIITGTDGRNSKINCAYVASNGDFKYNRMNLPYIKTLLPEYREFDEDRYFKSSEWIYRVLNYDFRYNFDPVPIWIDERVFLVNLSICEDFWDENYLIKPIDKLKKDTLTINLSCSPFTLNKNVSRDRVFSEKAKKLNSFVCYVNSIGLQDNGKTIYSFDGCSAIYSPNGDKVCQLKEFEKDYINFKYDKSRFILSEKELDYSTCSDEESRQIYKCLIYGIKNYTKRFGIKKVVIGASGGIDSSVVAALCVDALGKDNVYLVNMPTKFNSDATKNLAKKLAKNLGCPYAIYDISTSYRYIIDEVNSLEFSKNNDTAEEIPALKSIDEENIQARYRSASVLSAIASRLNAVYTCNGNKSELTVGYCTMYGDLSGFLAIIADLWKYQVYNLARYINMIDKNVIPEDLFNNEASAELSYDQGIEKGKGDPIYYPYHDKLFRSFIEPWIRDTPYEILSAFNNGKLDKLLGLNTKEYEYVQLKFSTLDFINDLEKWYKLFYRSIFKRVQAPPILAVSRRAFGFDFREALLNPYFSNDYLNLKDDLLKVAKMSDVK